MKRKHIVLFLELWQLFHFEETKTGHFSKFTLKTFEFDHNNKKKQCFANLPFTNKSKAL